jgi:hypothetical protein
MYMKAREVKNEKTTKEERTKESVGWKKKERKKERKNERKKTREKETYKIAEERWEAKGKKKTKTC